jgi:chemotaxis protein methyltransferase CheR
MNNSPERRTVAAQAALQAEDAPQVRAVLELLYEQTGMDFREYAFASIRRRVHVCMLDEGLTSVAELLERLGECDGLANRLLKTLTLPVTAMFRDPQFYLEFRELVVPLLRTHPYLRLWIAGCSTGQEVFSLAVLLHEEGLYERSRIYATDVQPGSLEQAQQAIFPVGAMQDYTRNYQAAGGRAAFSDYYTADSEFAILRPHLKQNIVFGMHNLVTDRSFNEFQVIFCRNVMIYFNAQLQERVHGLLYESLAMFGYLGLGRGESIRFSPLEGRYESVSARQRIYRKIA